MYAYGVSKIKKLPDTIYDNPLLVLFVLYFCSFFLILINNGVFFDDWHIYHFSEEYIKEFYHLVGRPIQGVEHLFFRRYTPSHYFINFYTFCAFWFTGVYFYLFLKKLCWYSKEELLWISALFIIYPQCYSRMCQTILPNSLSLTAFMITSYYYVFWPKDKSNFLKNILIFPFFFSFNLESMLMFYALPISFAYYFENERTIPFSFKSLYVFAKKNVLFLIIPFVYFIFINLRSSGGNNINSSVIKDYYKLMANCWRMGFYDCLYPVFSKTFFHFIYIAFCASAFAPAVDIKKTKQYILGLILAIGLYCYSVIPYILVGKDIQYVYIMDRNSIVSLFSCAFIIFYIVSIILSFTRIKYLKPLFIFIILLSFIGRNFTVYRSFLIASVKQDAFLEYVKTSPAFKDGKTFLTIDNTVEYLAKDTAFDSSVARGLISIVFPRHDKCIANIPNECINDEKNQDLKSPLHNTMNWVPGADDYHVVIDYGKTSIRKNKVFKAIFYKIFNEKKYYSELENILTISMIKINQKT